MTRSTQRLQDRLERQSVRRAAAEREAQRYAFAADIGELLAAATPDEPMMLAAVARRCVPFMGDWCVIDVLGAEGEFERAAIAHEDPEKVKAALETARRHPFNPRHRYGSASVFRSGKSLFYPKITEQDIRRVVKDEEYAQELCSYEPCSAIFAPLVARGRTLGVISFISAESRLEFDEDDLAVAEELGRRVGLAVDNARLVMQLEKAVKAKDEFLGLVSHELRTPITSIYGGAHLLRSRGDRLDRETMMEVIGDIGRESERLFRMVEDLLALARVELGEKIETEPVLVQRVIGKVVGQYEERKREVRLQVEGTPRPARGRRSYVEHVVRNLIGNSDKYSPEDAPIDVVVRDGKDGVEFVVLDSGPGLAPEQKAKLFDAFYRGGSSSGSVKGAGLGLTVCKRLVDAQSGRIEVENREPRGLEVRVVLPAYEEDDV